jgi:molybdopterin-guanine dinucleotide biosynthesis protein A
VKIAGIVLAGGQSRRMGGGDKCLRLLAGKPILAHIIERARPQVAALALSANGDPARFAGFDLPVVADSIADFAGPLAGVLAGLDWLAARNNGIEWLMSVPGDCPFLPDDLVERLHQARRQMGAGVPLACARSGEWRHPVVALWPLALRQDLRKALVEEDLRKIEIFTARHGVAIADWPADPIDPFFNVNTPEDAAKAEHIASGHAGG